MNREIGIVASGSEYQAIRFYSMNPIRTDYARICHEEGRTIYRITKVEIVNKRLNDSDFIRYISEGEDYSKYNIYVAEAVPLASISQSGQLYVDYWYIAAPGSVVEEATVEDIALAHGINKTENSQCIGYLRKCEDVAVWVNFKKVLITHMAIIGRSGQGKSNFCKIVLENLPMRFMVFTPANEYTDIKNAKLIDASGFSVPTEISILKKIFDLNGNEERLLSQALRSNPFMGFIESDGLAEMVARYYKAEGNAKIKNSVDLLCAKLKEREIRIGAKNAAIPRESYVFNMQKLTLDEQEIIIYLYLNRLLVERRGSFQNLPEGEEIPDRIVIFLEEAHNYIPSMKNSFCKDVINSIAREGRKLGIHLVLLSQRPRYLNPTTLSQCGSVISFNLANPDDIDYIMSNANFYDDSYKKKIQKLRLGECIIVSDYLNQGIDCQVMLRE